MGNLFFSDIWIILCPNSESELSAIADRVFHEADENSDGELTFEEFAEALKHIQVEERMSFLSLGQ